MVVGTLQIQLYIYEASSLKEKRSVVKSMLDGLRTRFSVAAAEVDLLDVHRQSVIGIACVSNEQAHANSILSKALDWVEANPRISVTGVEMEFG